MRSPMLLQVAQLARRSVIRTLRQPAVIVPSVLFPMLLLAVNSGGLQPATNLPGFPADSYLKFAFALPFLQGTLFAATAAGTDLARDIETGFLSRLSLTPVRPAALLIGQLAGTVVLAVFQGVVFLSIGLVIGVTPEAGVGGAVMLVLFMALLALGFGGIGAWLALRTGNGEAVQGLFPLLFVGLFLSSLNLPRNLIETDWFRTVATLNPISYMIEGIRSLIIMGWDAQALALGLGFGAGMVVIGLAASSSALRTRMVRT
ncbi:MAG: ABC transporter permease [Chloroflexota bacterium]|nr:ABC transporter permease [Chloroflexota bacterium]